MKIKAAITGFEAIADRSSKAGETLAKFMRKAVEKMALKVLVTSKEKLSGSVLNVRTGTLRRSISMKIQESKGSITATVGTTLRYGAVHEYGYSGPQQVGEHMRKVSQAFGRPLTKPTLAKVRAHVRQVKFPERSFLRTSLEENAQEIQITIEEAAEQAAQEILNG